MQDTLETVQVYGAQMDAEIARTILESHGIPAFVIDSHMASHQLLSTAIGGVRLQVRTEDALKAREILKDSAAKFTAENGDWGVCTSCGSTRLEPRRERAGFWWTLLSFGLPLWYPKTRVYCLSCGRSMRSAG